MTDFYHLYVFKSLMYVAYMKTFRRDESKQASVIPTDEEQEHDN